jgi:predicted ATPase
MTCIAREEVWLDLRRNGEEPPLALYTLDAPRRRLAALINTSALARTEPALFIIEDAHWIDAVSESMLA